MFIKLLKEIVVPAKTKRGGSKVQTVRPDFLRNCDNAGVIPPSVLPKPPLPPRPTHTKIKCFKDICGGSKVQTIL